MHVAQKHNTFHLNSHTLSGLFSQPQKLEKPFIIWLCLTRTGNYQIHEFDWLKWILTVV